MNIFPKLFFITILVSTFFTGAIADQKSGKEDLQKKIDLVQEQLDQIIDMGGKYAFAQLAKKKHLSPFAVASEKNGNTLMLEVPSTEAKATLGDKVIKLREMLKLAADNGRIHGGAVFVQAQVPHGGEKVDGVAIEIEHESGMSAIRFASYEIDEQSEKIKFKKSVSQIKPLVFFKDVLAKAKTSTPN